jgi:glycosyltransferase involved in cell wall biosynthesis
VLSLAEGVPVIGTAVDGLSDTLSHGCGVSVATEGPLALSEAIRDVLAGRAPIDPGGAVAYARQFSAAGLADFHLAHNQQIVAAHAQR